MSDTRTPPSTQVRDSQPPKPGEWRKGRHRRWVVHSHEASRPSHTEAKSDINITPLIDAMLVLLIIFMVVTPLAQKGLDIGLPQADTNKPTPQGQSQSNQVALGLAESATRAPIT